MIRDSITLTQPQYSSVYILKDDECRQLFSQCNPSIVRTAREVLARDGKIIQVYHPEFPKHAGDIFDNYDYVSPSIQLLYSYYPIIRDYDVLFLLRFPISKGDPFAYFILKKRALNDHTFCIQWPH